MPKRCPECEQVYPDFVDFCVADGARLERVSGLQQNDEGNGKEEPDTAELLAPPEMDHPDMIPGRARLFPKIRGETQEYGVEFFGEVVLGRFDPEAGAVDVDLSEVPDSRFISPQHARLTYEGVRWYVQDLTSENGVFVNRGPKLTDKTEIRSGDELALGNALFVFEADDDLEETKDMHGSEH